MPSGPSPKPIQFLEAPAAESKPVVEEAVKPAPVNTVPDKATSETVVASTPPTNPDYRQQRVRPNYGYPNRAGTTEIPQQAAVSYNLNISQLQRVDV